MRRSSTSWRRVAFGAFTCFVAMIYIAPMLWMAASSFKPDGDIYRDTDSLRSFIPTAPTFDHYVEAFDRGGLLTSLLNTTIVVIVVAGLGVVINGAAGFAFARLRFPGRGLLFTALVITIILPIEVIVIPLFLTLRSTTFTIDIVGERAWTLAALSLPFAAKAFNIFLMRQYFLSLPRALEEAALLDGASWWTIFWRVALPNAKPIIATVVVLDFVVHWNDYLWPLIICQGEGTRTVQLGLGNFFTQPPISWGAILAYSVTITAPLLLAFIVGQRWIVRSTASSGLRG